MNLGKEMKPPAAESADPRDMPVKVVESSGSGIPVKVVAVQSFPEGRREIMMSPAEERFMAVEGGKLRGISNPLKNKWSRPEALLRARTQIAARGLLRQFFSLGMPAALALLVMELIVIYQNPIR